MNRFFADGLDSRRAKKFRIIACRFDGKGKFIDIFRPILRVDEIKKFVKGLCFLARDFEVDFIRRPESEITLRYRRFISWKGQERRFQNGRFVA